jgi:hypothetical protein
MAVEPRILIAVAYYNRQAIAEQCVPTIRDGMKSGHDALIIYDDGSSSKAWDSETLISNSDKIEYGPNVGIDKQRQRHIRDFSFGWNKLIYTHLYLVDSDSPHDIDWRDHALSLQERCKGAPVCLYNTKTHEAMQNNTYLVDTDVIWRRFAPGVSYLLTAAHVEKIMPHLSTLDHWDWQVPALLGYKMVISRTSYCDHIGHGGLHDPKDGNMGDERALNPTPWLVKKREEIIKCLTQSQPA